MNIFDIPPHTPIAEDDPRVRGYVLCWKRKSGRLIVSPCLIGDFNEKEGKYEHLSLWAEGELFAPVQQGLATPPACFYNRSRLVWPERLVAWKGWGWKTHTAELLSPEALALG